MSEQGSGSTSGRSLTSGINVLKVDGANSTGQLSELERTSQVMDLLLVAG